MFQRLVNLVRGFFGLFISGLEKQNPEALLEVETENLRKQIAQYNQGLASHAGMCERLMTQVRKLETDQRDLRARTTANLRAGNRQHPQPYRAVRTLGLIGNVSIGAVGTPAPPVERALHAVADHRAAVADVSAEVFAMRLQHMQLTGLVAIGHQILAEIVQRADPANGKLGRPSDHEPSGDFPGERDFHVGFSCPRPLILNTLQY